MNPPGNPGAARDQCHTGGLVFLGGRNSSGQARAEGGAAERGLDLRALHERQTLHGGAHIIACASRRQGEPARASHARSDSDPTRI